MIQPRLFEEPQPDPFARWHAPPDTEWSHARGRYGWVAYDDAKQLVTESWNCPGAAVRAADEGQVSKRFYRQHVAYQKEREKVTP